jgi:ABC-type phosphate transport system auxiliary subunit
MEKHGQSIAVIEKKLKDTIEGTVTKTLKEAESEKAKFLSACENTKDLTDRINEYMNENAKKFEVYSQQVETKKIEIKTLEAEIETLRLQEKKHQKVTSEIADERSRLAK